MKKLISLLKTIKTHISKAAEKQVKTNHMNSLNASKILLNNPIESRNNSTSQIRGSIRTNIGNEDYNKRVPVKNPFLAKEFQN